MSLVNELCPRVNARPWIYRPHWLWHSNTRGKNRSYRTVKMFLPLCTQSLGLALVSVISPLSFILRLNNSAHFGKQIQCQDNAYACFYLRFTETSPCDVHESNVEIKVMRILRGVTYIEHNYQIKCMFWNFTENFKGIS